MAAESKNSTIWITVLIIFLVLTVIGIIIYALYQKKTEAQPWRKFDWAGKQCYKDVVPPYNCTSTYVPGLHVADGYDLGLVVGDYVEVKSPVYNGKFKVIGIGDDTDHVTLQKVLFRIETTFTSGTAGEWRKSVK